MDQHTVSAIDWIVVGLSSTLTLGSLAAGCYAVAYWSSPARPVAAEFNYLWRARFFYQFLAALFGLVQFLRLQVRFQAAMHPKSRIGMHLSQTYLELFREGNLNLHSCLPGSHSLLGLYRQLLKVFV
jgi:hypothetical protein